MNLKKPATETLQSETAEQPKLDLRREDDFTVRYADHIAIMQTGYAVKVTFGRLDPAEGPNVVFQHTAMTLPWPAVKTLIYLLQANLLAYEETSGHVPYPKGGIDPPRASLPEEMTKAFPKAREIHQKVLKLWEEFLAANPEARSEK
jgi:hypothetical protein